MRPACPPPSWSSTSLAATQAGRSFGTRCSSGPDTKGCAESSAHPARPPCFQTLVEPASLTPIWLTSCARTCQERIRLPHPIPIWRCWSATSYRGSGKIWAQGAWTIIFVTETLYSSVTIFMTLIQPRRHWGVQDKMVWNPPGSRSVQLVIPIYSVRQPPGTCAWVSTASSTLPKPPARPPQSTYKASLAWVADFWITGLPHSPRLEISRTCTEGIPLLPALRSARCRTTGARVYLREASTSFRDPTN